MAREVDFAFFDKATALRKAHPYRKGKRVMVANYEIYLISTVPSIMPMPISTHVFAQRWEIEAALLIHRGFGQKAIAVALTKEQEMRLP